MFVHGSCFTTFHVYMYFPLLWIISEWVGSVMLICIVIKTTVIWKMFVVNIFPGAGEARKLNAWIFMYNKHFVCLIFVGFHDPQKYFNTKNLQMKDFDTKFPKLCVSSRHVLLIFESCITYCPHASSFTVDYWQVC